MAHFYGNLQGNRGEATRMGTKDSGFRGHIRGWHIGGSVNCYYNESKDRDEVLIFATRGSNGFNSTSLVKLIETDSGDSKIYLNWKLEKLLSEKEYIQLKEDISALIETNIEHNKPNEETCNLIAESIMDQLNFKLDDTKE